MKKVGEIKLSLEKCRKGSSQELKGGSFNCCYRKTQLTPDTPGSDPASRWRTR